MLNLGNWNGRPITISAKHNSLTLSVESKSETQVFSFDCEGRLWTAMAGGVSYRRGLDGKIVAKWQTPDGGRDRRWLETKQAHALERQAWETASGLLGAVRSGEAQLQSPLSLEAERLFQQAVSFDAGRSRADAQRYHEVYRPIGILPPDQYMAVVLQATEGCAFNTCTFCTFYRDRPFRIKKPDEFRMHAEAVRDYLGEGLSLRRTIFMGDANALVTPMAKLLPLVEVIHQVYDVEALGGMYAFLDGFSGSAKTAHDYRRLAERGLVRAYIGLESGNEALLKFLKKPGKPSDAVQAVRAMKKGGVSVGVIVLLGAGGRKFSRQHVRDTIRALNEMKLDMDDLLYFSELVEQEDMEYVQDAYDASLKPLSAEERTAQGEKIERGLRFSNSGGVPHISRYDIREFVY
jgi:hypothetical protein